MSADSGTTEELIRFAKQVSTTSPVSTISWNGWEVISWRRTIETPCGNRRRRRARGRARVASVCSTGANLAARPDRRRAVHPSGPGADGG